MKCKTFLKLSGVNKGNIVSYNGTKAKILYIEDFKTQIKIILNHNGSYKNGKIIKESGLDDTNLKLLNNIHNNTLNKTSTTQTIDQLINNQQFEQLRDLLKTLRLSKKLSNNQRLKYFKSIILSLSQENINNEFIHTTKQFKSLLGINPHKLNNKQKIEFIQEIENYLKTNNIQNKYILPIIKSQFFPNS